MEPGLARREVRRKGKVSHMDPPEEANRRGGRSLRGRAIRWARSGGGSEGARGPLGERSNMWGGGAEKVKFGTCVCGGERKLQVSF